MDPQLPRLQDLGKETTEIRISLPDEKFQVSLWDKIKSPRASADSEDDSKFGLRFLETTLSDNSLMSQCSEASAKYSSAREEDDISFSENEDFGLYSLKTILSSYESFITHWSAHSHTVSMTGQRSCNSGVIPQSLYSVDETSDDESVLSESDVESTSSSSTKGKKGKFKSFLKRKPVNLNLLPNNQATPSPGDTIHESEKLIKLPKQKPKGATYFYCEDGLLGEGGLGKVYKGYSIHGKKKTPVAVKFVEYSSVRICMMDKDLGLVPAEVYLLKKMMQHKHVIKFLDYIKLSPDEFVIITERPENCSDLYHFMKKENQVNPMSEDEARKLTQQLVSVARKMEKDKLVHRDIKLENILYDFDTEDIKLVDFGLAKYYVRGVTYPEFASTEINIPPEFILNNEYDVSKAAVWSVGIVLYTILHGHYPYADSAEVLARLPHVDGALSGELHDLLSGMFALDPNQRLTLKEVERHPWMNVKVERRSVRSRISSFVRGFLPGRRAMYDLTTAKKTTGFFAKA